MGLDQFRKGGHRPDFLFIALIFVLLGLGLIAISSASVVQSYELYGNNFVYVIQQLKALAIGLVAFFITASIDYRVWKKYASTIMIIGLFLLVLVFIPPIGAAVKGAHRWIDLGFVRFQASEVMKLAFIIYLAHWLELKSASKQAMLKTLVPFGVLLALVIGLIMLQPDMGTTSVLSLTAMLMYFMAGAPLVNIGILGATGIASAWTMIKLEPYRFARLLVFLNPDNEKLGIGYHVNQALLAIGAGGLWGLGFGQSRQKYLYLPEPHTDSIFAILAEELGFIRSSLIIVLILLLVWRGFLIARHAPDLFARLLVIGIIGWVMLQTFINIAAMLAILPLTGVPLPFISYGGTSVAILLAALGIVVNISKFAKGNR